MKKIYLGILVGILALVNSFVSADLAGYRIDSYQVSMDLSEDGSMEIKEDIGVTFSESRRGIYRTIPIYNPSGRYTIVENFRAIGDPASYSKEGNYYQLRIGDPNIFHLGEKNYRIEYKVKNAIAGFGSGEEAWTELYRNVIGTERETSIDDVSFSLYLPKAHIFGSGEYYAVYGKVGEKKNEAITMIYDEIQHRFEGKLNQRLLNKEGVTIGVKFPSDYFTLSQEYLSIQAPTHSNIGKSTYTSFGRLVKSGGWGYPFRVFFFLSLGIISIILGIKYKAVKAAPAFVFILFGMFLLFTTIPTRVILFFNAMGYMFLYPEIIRNMKKIKKKKRPITIYYTPPKEIDLIMASKIAEIDPQRTLVALIYERAANGEIAIEQIKKRILFFMTKEYLFHKKIIQSGGLVGDIFSKEEDDTILTYNGYSSKLEENHRTNNNSYNELLEIIFSKKTSKLSELTWENYQSFLIRLENKQDKKTSKLSELTWENYQSFLIRLENKQDKKTKKYYTTETKKLLKIFSYKIEILNERGEEIYEEIRGFKYYLSKVESPYLVQMLKEDPLYLDKMLPWAVLLGVETKFLQAVQNHLGQLENPTWYTGEDAFSVMAVGVMTRSILSGINPPSERFRFGGGSSGFSSSGGSSGGGGGGGGGGSW